MLRFNDDLNKTNFFFFFNFVSRKTCGSCKCTKDSHDVLHEEWVNVRDRLGFKPVQDPDKRVSKERSYSQGYSWVPPGLPSHKVCVWYFFFSFCYEN